MTTPRTFSAVICAYTEDRWPELEAALTSVCTQSRLPDEVILVVDHNRELLDRAASSFRDVRCIPNVCSPGLSGARNSGVQVAGGDVVGFLDDDAVAAPDWIERMLRAYVDETVLGVGGWIRPNWRAPRPDWLPDEFLWVVGCSYAGLPTRRAEVRNPIGANMSFRREVVTTAGGFDGRFGRLGGDAAGCEETEFAIRARHAHTGGRIILEPAASCDHAVGPDRVTRRYFRRRCAAEGRSKALVRSLVGAEAALSTERVYVRRTLPRAFSSGLRDALRGDRWGAARSWSIVEGTAVTAVSYLVTTWRLARTPATRAS